MTWSPSSPISSPATASYAVFALMALDALLPVGGELIMVLAGALAAGTIAGAHPALFGTVLDTGLESYLALALGGTVGYLFGAMAGWVIGRRGGRALLERHGRRLHLGPQNLQRAEHWFARHRTRAVFLGRLTPMVRSSFISIPAGALGSPLGPYAALSLLGSAMWCFAFAGAGPPLGSNYGRVHQAFQYVDVVAVAAAVAAMALVAVQRRRRSARQTPR